MKYHNKNLKEVLWIHIKNLVCHNYDKDGLIRESLDKAKIERFFKENRKIPFRNIKQA